jgi:4-aminobutyrate aminotransferase-like enzyme
MQALELVKDETVKDRTPSPDATLRIFEATKSRGLLIGKGGLYGNTVRIAPPLNIVRTDIEEALRILDDAFATIEPHRPA